MRLKIEWTREYVTWLLGSLVQVQGEVCVLCWDQLDASTKGTRVWLLSWKDGMLYHYGTIDEAVKKLNENAVTLHHRPEKITLSAGLL